MRIALAMPDRLVTPEWIEAGLEASTRANQALLQQGLALPASQLLAKGAKWRPEPRSWGTEHFDLLPTIEGRGWGDCDDWAPGLAAEMRESGEDPGARAVIRRSGAKKWHALVQSSDGTMLDPSKWAGMPSGRAPILNQKFGDSIAGAVIAPAGRAGWFARCDLPMETGHIVGVGWGCKTPGDALCKAVASVAPSHVMGDEVMGRTQMIIGDLFGDILPVAGTLAGTALGGPLGGMAGGMAGKALGGMFGGGGGSGGAGAPPSAPDAPTQAPSQTAALPGGGQVSYGPGAPIIVRF